MKSPPAAASCLRKKNPDSLELLRGKSGRVIGNLTRLLVLLKGLPLTYNKDLQEDKEALFDTLDTLLDCLQVAQVVVSTLKIDAEAARKALEGDFMTATDLADYLVRKGMAFREAHGLVGRIVLECEQQQIGLSELPLSRYRQFSSLFAEDLFQALSVQHSIEARSVAGWDGAGASCRSTVPRGTVPEPAESFGKGNPCLNAGP